MGIDSDSVDFPEQVVRDAASDLRKRLRNALGDGWKDQDPLPSNGKGKDLTYRLVLHIES